jgi:hypothetical protein
MLWTPPRGQRPPRWLPRRPCGGARAAAYPEAPRPRVRPCVNRARPWCGRAAGRCRRSPAPVAPLRRPDRHHEQNSRGTVARRPARHGARPDHAVPNRGLARSRPLETEPTWSSRRCRALAAGKRRSSHQPRRARSRPRGAPAPPRSEDRCRSAARRAVGRRPSRRRGSGDLVEPQVVALDIAGRQPLHQQGWIRRQQAVLDRGVETHDERAQRIVDRSE